MMKNINEWLMALRIAFTTYHMGLAVSHQLRSRLGHNLHLVGMLNAT